MTIQGENIEAPFSTGNAAPRTPAPLGATDCHVHIFDPRFPRAPGRTGPDSTVATHLLFRRRLGLSRSVIVHPSSYGTDNRALLDALEQLGDTSRGVAFLTAQTTDAEIAAMHALGVRGARLYIARENPPSPDDLRAYARRVAPLGWHLQLVVREAQLTAAENVLMDLPCNIVLDHFAHLAQPWGINQPAGDTVKRLLAKGHTYMKLSAVYSVSGAPPAYDDLGGTASALIAEAPERMLWGSDWPHTTVKHRRPDGAQLFDLLTQWAPDADTRRRILVDNPTRLYWAG